MGSGFGGQGQEDPEKPHTHLHTHTQGGHANATQLSEAFQVSEHVRIRINWPILRGLNNNNNNNRLNYMYNILNNMYIFHIMVEEASSCCPLVSSLGAGLGLLLLC